MGTKYTYDGTTTTSSAGFDKPTLTNSTIANYAYVEDDPYLRVLSAKNGGTFEKILIGSGGTMYLSGGASVTSITLNGANSAYLRMSGGGVVTSLTMSGGSYHGFGAVVSNIYISGAANTANRATFNMYWNAARISGGYIQNATLNISCGSAVNVTFDTDTYINVAGSGFNASGAWTAGGNIRGGRAQNGASIRLRQSGGYVSGMTFDNATLEQYCLGDVRKNLAKGLTFTNGAKFNNGLTSGNTNYSGGIASDLTFVSQSFMQVRNGADVTIASFDAESYLLISGGATVKTVTLTDSSYVKVSSGGVLTGATVGKNCYVQVGAGGGTTSSGGRATDVTIQSGGTLSFVGGTWKNSWNDWFTYNQFASNVTIQSGGTAAPVNYAMLMNVNAEAGAKITRGANLIGLGGDNTNIVKGVFTNNELGDDFQVVGGTATGMDLATNAAGRSAFLIFSGLTVSGATVSAGGSLFLFDGAKANGVDVYGTNAKDSGALLSMWKASASNVGIGSGGKLIVASTGAEADNVSVCHGSTLVSMTAGTISGLVMSGGTLTTAQNSNKKYIYNVDITKAAGNTYPVINISSGTYLSGGSIYGSAQFNLRYGVVEDVYFGADTWNNIYVGGSILGGVAGMGADMRMGYGNSGALIDGMLFLGNAKVHLRDTRATVKNLVMSGNSYGQIDVSAGVVSSATLWNGSLIISGGSVTSGTGEIILGKAIVNDTLIRSNGRYLQSGGTATNTSIYTGGSGFYLYDDFDYDGETVVSNLTLIGNGSDGATVESGVFYGFIYGGIVSGGSMRRATIMISGGEIDDVNFGEYTWINNSNGEVNDCVASDGATIRGRGATINRLTLTDSATRFEFSKGVANDIVLRNGASMYVSSGANVTLNGVTVSDGARLRLYNGATAANATVSAGGTMYLSGTAKVTGIAAEAGANIEIDLSGKTAGSANFDSLANVNSLTIQNYNPGNGTYTLADTGNTSLKVGIVGSRVFDGEVAAGSSWVNPLIAKQFNLNAAGTELGVSAYTRVQTNQAVGFATSGATINTNDKELQWEVASITAPVTLIAAATTVAGNAWLDIHTCTADAGATIFGVAQNVDFAGKLSYQLHGGNTLANVAFGANYGGSVKGVDILSYNTVYTGVGYAGGFGTVGADGIEVVFASNCALQKDFYAGALCNYAKTGERTSVSSIRASIGESAGQVAPTVKGNFYGGGAVKAGTITTTAGTSALQTVGDITLTLLAGTATKGAQACVFAGGYATGHDTAKLAPVYTVESVTLNVGGGDWGAAAGGRGIFGGAFASDNTASADNGVYAMVGNVNLTVSGGTMGNVYGGGWAQKGAKSEVGDVNLTVTGGTIANIFGGGSTSTSGGSTVAGKVTITVSGGTINGDIYARGQNVTDATGAASVIFTGANDFHCGVYGYSYVGGTDNSATLSFSDYTGTFSGKLGGFDYITVEGNSWMTLGAAAGDVSNSKWIFDFDERDLGLDGQAALTWSTADFTEDTITLRIASTRSEGWTLVSGADASKYNTAADKFLVEIDGGTAIELTFDATVGKTDAIADGAYQGWGFAVEDSVLKFKNLA